MTVALGRLAAVNPPVPEFPNEADSPVTFVPLECVWPDGRADFTRRRPANAVSTGYTLFRRGDVLVPKITPTFEAGRVAVADIPTEVGAGTTELHIVRPRSEVDARFLAYVLRSQPFLQDGATRLQGVGNLRRVPAEFLERFAVAISDPRQQRAIADYLDRETAQIDTLIGEQQSLLTTLEERRSAVIDAALTARVETQPYPGSVRDWISRNAPAGWRAVQARHLLALGPANGVSPEVSAAGDLKTLTLGAIRHGRVLTNDVVTKFVDRSRVSNVDSLRLSPGDVLIVRGNGNRDLVARAGIVGADFADKEYIYPDLLVRIRTSAAMLPEYFVWAWNSAASRAQILSGIRTAVGTFKVAGEDIRSVVLPVPPLEEQHRIVDHLREETSKIDALAAEVTHFIDLSHERKAALLTAAVTGEMAISS